MIAGGTVSWDDYAKGADPYTLDKQIKMAESAGKELPDHVIVYYSPTELQPGQAYYAGMKKREVHGGRYQIWSRDITFMKLDESTLSSEETLGYIPEYDTWTDVRKIWFADDLNDPRLQPPAYD